MHPRILSFCMVCDVHILHSAIRTQKSNIPNKRRPMRLLFKSCQCLITLRVRRHTSYTWVKGMSPCVCPMCHTHGCSNITFGLWSSTFCPYSYLQGCHRIPSNTSSHSQMSFTTTANCNRRDSHRISSRIPCDLELKSRSSLSHKYPNRQLHPMEQIPFMAPACDKNRTNKCCNSAQCKICFA